jgi:hypothetical protein
LVEGFYNLRAGYTKYEGFGWYLTGDNTHRNALYEAKRKADNERVEAASSAVKAVQRMRRKMDRLQAFFEDEARK